MTNVSYFSCLRVAAETLDIAKNLPQRERDKITEWVFYGLEPKTKLTKKNEETT